MDTYPFAAVRLTEGFAADARASPIGDKTWLGPLTRLNVFIGANNTGKSRLLRSLLQRVGPALNYAPYIAEALSAHSHVRTFAAWLRENCPSESTLSSQLEAEGDRALSLTPWCHRQSDASTSEISSLAKNIHRTLTRLSEGWHPPSPLTSAMVHVQTAPILAAIHPLTKPWTSTKNTKLFYVPSLRTTRSLGALHADVPTTREPDLLSALPISDYGLSGMLPTRVHAGKEWHFKILSGQDFYDSLQSRLLGSWTERQWVRSFESYLSNCFFQNRDVTLIPKLRSVLHIKIGEEAERPIQFLGDGIQQVLLLTYPYMLSPDDHVVLFVEEPELYLHPGFQRALIEAWLSHPGSLQVFVATHSSQFLDITLDRDRIATFRCTKTLLGGTEHERDVQINVTRIEGQCFDMLHDLGMRNSSVLLANCTIWVEGLTDRMYLRHWLALYSEWRAKGVPTARRFLEDVHFSFVEYGGNAITHYSVLPTSSSTQDAPPIAVESLCGELFLIADQDDPEAKKSRHDQLRRILGDRFYLLPVREIENMITPQALLTVLRSYGEDPAGLNTTFKMEDYQSARLGSFIEKNVLTKGSCRRGTPPYSDNSGSIKDKTVFARSAIAATDTWEAMSNHAQALTHQLVAFIAKHNA